MTEQDTWEDDCLLYEGVEDDLTALYVTFRNVEDIETYCTDESGVVMFKTSPGEAEELRDQMENNRFGFDIPGRVKIEFVR